MNGILLGLITANYFSVIFCETVSSFLVSNEKLGSEQVEYFYYIEEILSKISNERDVTHMRYGINLNPSVIHNITANWEFQKELNLSIFSESENEKAEIFFANTDAFIHIMGTWSFSNISFKFMRSSPTLNPILKVAWMSRLHVERCQIFEREYSIRLGHGFIESEARSIILFTDTSIILQNFYGIFLLGHDSFSLLLKNLTFSFSSLHNGRLLSLRGNVNTTSLVEEISFRECNLSSFILFDFALNDLVMRSINFNKCSFLNGSIAVTINEAYLSLEKVYKLWFFNFVECEFPYQKAIQLNLLSAEFKIEIFEIFLESSQSIGGGFIDIYASSTVGSLNISNIFLTASLYEFGVRINAASSIAIINNVTCLANCIFNGKDKLGPCLYLILLLNASIINFKALLNSGSYESLGIKLEKILNNTKLEQGVFIENSMDSSEAHSCVLLIFSYSNTESLMIISSHFEKNFFSSESEGGPVIKSISHLLNLTIVSSYFKENRAKFRANVIEFSGNRLTLLDSYFAKNVNFYYDGTSNEKILESSTGIIIAKTNVFQLKNCEITENIGKRGNFYLIEHDFLIILIEGISFTNNIAKYGNFLYIEEGTKTLDVTIKDSFFENNLNMMYGLLIYIYSPNPVISNKVNIYSSIFKNERNYDEGYLYINIYFGEGFFLIENCLFFKIFIGIYDEKQNLSGTMITSQGLYDSIWAVIRKCQFLGIESAGPFGALIYASQTSYEIVSSLFKDIYEKTTLSGFDQNCTVVINNCVFFNITGEYSALFFVVSSRINLANSVMIYLFSYSTVIDSKNTLTIIKNNTFSDAFVVSKKFGCFILLRESEQENSIVASSFIEIGTIFLNLDSSGLFFSMNSLNYTLSTVFKLTNVHNMTASNIRLINSFLALDEISQPGFLQSSDANIFFSDFMIEGFFAQMATPLAIVNRGNFVLSEINIEKIKIKHNYLFLVSYAVICSIKNLVYNFISHGVLFATSSNITIQSLKIVKGGLATVSAMHVKDSQLIYNDSICVELETNSPLGGACLFIISTSVNLSEIRIFESQFINNTSLSGNGGAIYMSIVNAVLKSNIFERNKAQFGGAIFLFNEEEFTSALNQRIHLILNRFSLNNASKSGGAIYWDIVKPDIETNNVFLGNIASLYGDDFASPSIRMILEVDQQQSNLDNELKLNQIKPGGYIINSIAVKIADAYFQEMVLDKSVLSEISVLNSPVEVSFIGRSTGELSEDRKSCLFNKFAISANETNTTIQFIFKTNKLKYIKENVFKGVTNVHKNEFFINGEYALLLPAKIIKCEVGEILQKDGWVCKPCPSGYYSYNQDDKSCKPCLRGSTCLGGKAVKINPGFWRAHPLSENIYACNRAFSSCKGGFDELCNDYFIGVKCEKCVNDKSEDEIYERTIAGKCSPCSKVPVLLLTLTLKVIITSFLFTLFTYIFKSPKYLVSTKIAMKTLIWHAQYFMIMQSYESSIPIYVRDYLSYFGTFGQLTSVWFSFECILKNVNKNYSPHMETLLVEMTCVFSSLISIPIYKLFCFICLRRRKSCLSINWKEFLIFSFYVYGPPVSDYLISYMVCQEIEGIFVLRRNPEVPCLSLDYKLWVILFYIPVLLLQLLIPIALHSISLKSKVNIRFEAAKHQLARRSLQKSTPIHSILNVGFKENYVILPEVYAYSLKIVLILINQSTLDIDIKYYFLLFIIITSILYLDLRVMRSRMRLFSFLDFTCKFSASSVIYLLIWISNDDMPSYVSKTAYVNHTSVFVMIIVFQMLNLALHVIIISREWNCHRRHFLLPRSKMKKIKVFPENNRSIY